MNAMRVFSLTLVLCLAAAAWAQAPDDDELIGAAQYALSKSDCAGAVRALSEVSEGKKSDPSWLSLSANANECAGNLQEALAQLRRLQELAGSQPEIAERISRIRYRMVKGQGCSADCRRKLESCMSACYSGRNQCFVKSRDAAVEDRDRCRSVAADREEACLDRRDQRRDQADEKCRTGFPPCQLRCEASQSTCDGECEQP